MRVTAAFFMVMVSVATALVVPPASATPSRLTDLASPDGVLRWINAYRTKPDPAGVPLVVKALSGFGALKDPEQAGAYTGFLAGVIHNNPGKAEEMIGKMLPLPPGDQWIVIRAIVYSEHPEWRNLLRRFSDRLPARKVMIDKYLTDSLPGLWQIPPESPSTWRKVRSYVTFESLPPEPPRESILALSPEVLDTYWGYFFATGAHRPISRIIAMLPMSKDHDNVERLTLGNMAKYSLAANAARDVDLMAMLKRAQEHSSKPEEVEVLKEVIESAETVEIARLRREALAALDELKRKGSESKRNVTWWGTIGQGALAVGCIAAAATGHIELGLPCIISGGVSSAALGFWEKQP
jgi:hypothetical protein